MDFFFLTRFLWTLAELRGSYEVDSYVRVLWSRLCRSAVSYTWLWRSSRSTASWARIKGCDGWGGVGVVSMERVGNARRNHIAWKDATFEVLFMFFLPMASRFPVSKRSELARTKKKGVHVARWHRPARRALVRYFFRRARYGARTRRTARTEWGAAWQASCHVLPSNPPHRPSSQIYHCVLSLPPRPGQIPSLGWSEFFTSLLFASFIR